MTSRRETWWLIGILALLLSITQVSAHGDHETVEDIAFEQKLDAQLPLDAVFTDETGARITLETALGDTPTVFVFSYYECQTLCSVVLPELANTLEQLPALTPGDDYSIISVSIDPNETAAIAAEAKRDVIPRRFASAANNWYFLTGDTAQIDRVAQAAGFHYTYLPEMDEYAHATGILVLTPQGRIARYIYGIDYPAQDVRLALVEADESRIASPVERVLLACYRYNPQTGRYTPAIFRLIRIAGVLTTLIIGGWIVYLLRSEAPATPQKPKG